MSEMSEKARAAGKEKVKRYTDKGGKVDASGWTEAPCGFMDTQKKLGNRPISKQNLACGGKAAHKHGGRKGRDMGGPASSAGANYVANVPAPPQNRFSFTGQPSPFLGAAGMAKGGRMHKMDGGGMGNPGRKRMFPGYTTEEMEQSLANNPSHPRMAEMSAEIAARKSGASRPFSTPQIEGRVAPQPPKEHPLMPPRESVDKAVRQTEQQEGKRKFWTERSSGGGNWIAGATKHKGALHKELGVPEGKKIPEKKLKKAEHSDNPTERKRADLAVTLKRMNKAEGGQAEEIIGNRPTGGRMPKASGGSAGKGKMNVNIIIAQKPEHPPMGPPGMQGGMPPKPPGPMPIPGAPPGGAPQGMPAPPPGAPPPMGGPNMPPPSMGRASGGKVYPDMKYASGGGKGRLEKIKKYGDCP